MTARGVFNQSQIEAFLREMLSVLKFVHENRVIHRDIKPDNIMRRKSDGKFVLIDFGVSKEFRQTVMVPKGTAIGTYGYAPIEQMKAGEAYPASDLFSLGATCFFLLTKISPFNLFLNQGYGWINGWQQHLRQPLDEGLVSIIDKMLSENHRQRYGSTEDVLRDLSPPNNPKKSFYSLFVPAFAWKGMGLVVVLVMLVGIVVSLMNPPGDTKNEITSIVESRLINTMPFLQKTITGSDTILAIAISPDGQTLVCSNFQGQIKIWNLVSGKVEKTIIAHTGGVSSIAFSPDGGVAK